MNEKSKKYRNLQANKNNADELIVSLPNDK